MRPLLSIQARNFRSLRKIDVTLGSLNVLVGPNEAGKSNFLDLIDFLGDSARYDLAGALDMRGGYGRVRFRGIEVPKSISISVRAAVTSNASESAQDEYDLTFWSRKAKGADRSILLRNEDFKFKRTRGRGRRISVHGQEAELIEDVSGNQAQPPAIQQPLRSDSLALSTLRRLPPQQGGREIEKFAELFTTFFVFNPDVAKARLPSAARPDESLLQDASNLATVILNLAQTSDDFDDFLDDARAMIPGFLTFEFEPVGGPSPAVAVRLIERGLADSTYLSDASFGTVRILALLALLYDPAPPKLTCIEEIDHGLHPYLFDRLVERLREAAQRTQILVATHSPALVNRLRPEELIVVERDPDGSTRMPAISHEQIAEKHRAVDGHLDLGELWFTGSLGGVPR